MHFALRMAVVVGVLLCATCASKDVLVIGPNIIRLDAEETVLVTMLQQGGPVKASVYLQDFPGRQKTYSMKTINLQKDNPQKVVVTVKSSEFSDTKRIEEDQQRYLYLVVESTDPKFKFKRESTLLVQASSGYVFIQTDKPIYNPRQQVHIRVLPVDQSLMLLEIPVRVDILNPQGIIVERKNYPSSKKYIVHTHLIVDNPMMGNWTVRASYGKNNKSFTSVQFEVREYILPVFEVIVRANRYILPQTKDLTGSVEARYLHGKPVKGTAKLYIDIQLNGKVTPLGNIKRKSLVDGIMRYSLDISDLLQPLGLGGFPDSGRLILRAEVTESATYNRETKEDRSCLFVRSPYKISLAESSGFFKPSLVYEVRVKVGERGAGPAKDLKVLINLKEKSGNTVQRTRDQELHLDENGRGIAGFGLLNNVNQLEISVETKDDKFPDNPGKAVLVAQAYKSPSNSYLAVRCDKTIGTVGGHLNLELVVPDKANKISAINIMIISRGRVVYTKTLQHNAGLINTDLVTVTKDMVPSIRVVGYYIVGQEVVADSLWIDIEDECGSEVEISSDEELYAPDAQGFIILKGEAGTTVGLSMVDAAVFLLNDRHLLTRKKMFGVLDKFDLGCGPGGGRDSSDVFMSSGLSVVSTGFVTKTRHKLTCDAALDRQRREADVRPHKKVTHREMCCSLGEKVFNGSLCYKEAKAQVNATRACRQEFYRCCRIIAKCRAGDCPQKGRSLGDEDDIMNMDIDESEELVARSNFKESTMLQSYIIGPNGEKRIHMTVPSSITRWMIQGVTLSPTAGMCIANPYNVTVFKEFYIDLRLPSKAVRGEQVEVKVTVYNFQRIDTKVVVYLHGVSGICSDALPGKKSSPRYLRILKNDAASTSFPIMPLESGQYTIKVEARTPLGGDAVEKQLLVVPEGKRVTVQVKSMPLDPQGILAGKGRNRRNANHNAKSVTEEIDISVPKDIIKGTESCTASIIGTVMGPFVETSIDGVSDLLAIPRGCGEQTMIRMAPTVYAMTYLSQTNPDLKNIEEKGHKLIQQGYARELTYRKTDGSYAAWIKRPSSTWLTAFVMKVFCQARAFVDIDQEVISSGLAWLQTKQLQDGRYKEYHSVIHKEMIGGVKEDVSLTAFVLITLRECHAGQPGHAPGELSAIRFLEGQLEKINDLYTKAILTYALSLTSSEKKQRANELLRKDAVYIQEKSIRYWPVNGENTALAVEATSYALMAQLELQDKKYTHAIVNWLIQKRNSKGAFKSTQDTVVGLQAITKYSIENYQGEIDLECNLESEADAQFNKKVRITKEDALVLKRVKRVPIGGKLIVEAKGSGVGQLQVDLSFNIPREKDELCRFELAVICTDVKFVVDDDRQNCDICGECEDEDDEDYDFGDIGIIPIARSANSNKEHAKSSPRRSRIGRQVARIGGAVRNQPRNDAEGGVSKAVVCINIVVSSLTGSDTGMSIIDVGLFTGFTAFKGDLEQLKATNAVDNYEINDDRVILYLPKIPKKDPAAEPLSVKFRARQDLRVGNIQPASVRVYYYYEPDEVSCTEFYRPEDQSPIYETICVDGQCKCAEGHCPKCYESEEKLALKRNDLMAIACNQVDYVYKVKVTEVKEDSKALGLLQRKISVDLQEILKPGSDRLAVEDSSIDLFMALSCGQCPQMEDGKIYLLMARDGPVEGERRKYILDESAFVMEFYDRRDRKLDMNLRRLGNQMTLFTHALETGCNK